MASAIQTAAATGRQAHGPLTRQDPGSGKVLALEDAKEGPLVPPSPSQGYNCTEKCG